VRARLYAVCSPPGPLPTTTTSYSPGGNGRSSSRSKRSRLQPPRFDLEHSIHHTRLLEQKRLQLIVGMIRQRRREVAITSAVGARPSRSRSRRRSRPAEMRTLLAVNDDLHVAVEDHIEAASGDVLADDACPSAKTSRRTSARAPRAEDAERPQRDSAVRAPRRSWRPMLHGGVA
jgi:hypothetical protein